MKNTYISILLLLLLFACNPAKDNHTSMTMPALEALDNKIQSWVDSTYYNGAAILIVKDNQPLFEKYYGGFSDTTTLHVASAGKWIAAATIATVVDKGLLSWDDQVRTYLPQFTDTKGDATLRQLLSHTAGYPDYQPSHRKWDDYQTLQEAVENIAQLPADTLPGTLFRYGGLAMQVAGHIAEIVTGKDWETIFQENIARPLKMQHSGFTPVSEESGFNPMLAGGYKTCLKDYTNFLSMIANNGMFQDQKVLSVSSIAELEANQIKQAFVFQPEYVQNIRQNLHSDIYGLGLWREEIDQNGTATLISSPGWAGTYPWVDRKNNVYGFMLAKVNVWKANEEGFSSFYSSPVLPALTRRAIQEAAYPKELRKGNLQIGNDTFLYYEELGTGQPLILLHGHSLDHTMWDEQFFELAKHYRVIRYDMRGYGYSSPQNETDQFTHVDDLVLLMDALQIDKAHVVGLSLGGYVATDMLGWYPERMISATLASGNLRLLPKPSIPMSQEEAEKREHEIAALKKQGVEEMKREWLNGLINSGGSNRERMRKPLWEMIQQWDAWQPLHKEVRVIAGEDAFELLKQNQPILPVMILEGNAPGNNYYLSPEILKFLPNGQLKIIEDAGHMLNMEQPEQFNEILLSFLGNWD